MTTILPAARSPWQVIDQAIGNQIAQNLPGAIQQGQQQAYQQQLLNRQNQSVANQFGPQIAALPPDLQKLYINDMLKNQRMEKEQNILSNLYSGNLNPTQQEQYAGYGLPEGQTEQQLPFDITTIPDEKIAQVTAMNPNLGRLLQQQKEAAFRNKIAAEDLKLRQQKMEPEFKRQEHLESSQAQADVKYNQSLQDLSRQHELKEQTLNNLETLNRKGVTGKPFEKLLEKFGLTALTSEGRREFAAGVKNLITDIRSILGGQFSQAEFMTILNAYPNADFSKGANEAIIKNLKQFQDIKTKEVEFAEQLKKENGGKIPVDFQSKVNEKVREYAHSKMADIKENTKVIMNEEYGIPKGYTLMFDDKGEPLSVPENEVEKYKSLGASLP